MKTKTYKQISKGELKKYNGYKCDFITYNGDKIKDGKIYVADDGIYILSNDKNAYWYTSNIEGYKYEWIIYTICEGDNVVDNKTYKEITIYIPEEFKEGEEIEVREEDDNLWKKRIFLYKDKNGKYLCVAIGYNRSYNKGNYYISSSWEQARKIENTIKIHTEDGQAIEIEKEKAIELGFKIN